MAAGVRMIQYLYFPISSDESMRAWACWVDKMLSSATAGIAAEAVSAVQ